MRFDVVPTGSVAPNPDQPRKQFHEEALRELAASIDEIGLMQPLVVRPVEDGYEIIAGERRWRACVMNAAETIPVVIREADDDLSLVLATAENVNRKDMTIIEEADAYRRVMKAGRPIGQVAKLFGKSTGHVQSRLDLLRLDPTLQDMAGKGHVGTDVAWYLSKLSVDSQWSVWRRINEGEFVTDSEIIRFCQAREQHESSPVMFEMESDAVVEKRRKVRDDVDRYLGAIGRTADTLDKMFDMSDEDLVVGLGQGMEQLIETLSALERHARAVRIRVEKAEAIRRQSA